MKIHLNEIVLTKCSRPPFWTFPRDTWWVNLFYMKRPYILLQCITLFYHSNLLLKVPFVSHRVIPPHPPVLFCPTHFCRVPFYSCSNCTFPMIIHIFAYRLVSWSQRKKQVCPSFLPFPNKLFAVSCPGLQDQWTLPLTTHCPTQCRRQGTLTPPKSEYNSCPGFF